MKKTVQKRARENPGVDVATQLSAARLQRVRGGATAIEYGVTAIEYGAPSARWAQGDQKVIAGENATAIEYGL
jgi:Flp pilus assembly pilin Flp